MIERDYTVVFEPDPDGGYFARVPFLPGSIAFPESSALYSTY